MKFSLPIHQNPLRTRGDVEQALFQMLEPLKAHFVEGDAGLHLGDFGAHYGEKSIRVEAFSRLLWGLAPVWVHNQESEYFARFRQGLVNGTDPDYPAYWGEVFDYDQKIVEMAAIALALMLDGDRLSLNEHEAKNLHTWLGSVNGRDIPQNNWLFFRVLVNTAFRHMGWPYDQGQMDEDLEKLDSYYLGDGWYCDGQPTQMDYYIPFGMHYYGLIYAKFAEELDPQRSKKFKKRAAEFAGDYLYWFDDVGAAMPFGRSLTYRFGQCAFFSALAFADVEALDWGVVKGRVLGNLRYWLSQPIFTADGLLSVGYAYPNLFMSENYNAPGSPYWAFKAFLVLALDEDHPFWQAEEEIPQLMPRKALHRARLLTTRGKDQVQFFPAGQACMNQLGNCAAKYEKLAYSTKFGFSVPRGDTLEEGAFDSCMVFSEAGEERYRMQRGFDSFEVTDEYICRTFRPLRGVTVRVKVVPSYPEHIRQYTITTDRPIDVVDSGFAIAAEWEGTPYPPDMVTLTAKGVCCDFPWGTSGIQCEEGIGEPILVKAYPNTNLLHNITRIPAIKFHLEVGTHKIITIITGK